MFSAKLCGWGGYLYNTQANSNFPEICDFRDEIFRQAVITPLQPDRRQGDPMRTRALLVFVLLAVTGLSAQTFRGTILGTVTDPSGAVVAGAKVTAKNTGTGLERSTETSGDGSY